MDADPQGIEADIGLSPIGALSGPRAPAEAHAWNEHLDWGPRHMLNDMGPATVLVSAEDLEDEAASLFVRQAVVRAIEQGEEYEYDE